MAGHAQLRMKNARLPGLQFTQAEWVANTTADGSSPDFFDDARTADNA
jgi:hypothetical protein